MPSFSLHSRRSRILSPKYAVSDWGTYEHHTFKTANNLDVAAFWTNTNVEDINLL